MTRTVGIYVFDNVEVLDYAGPYEVFTCADRVGGGALFPAPLALGLVLGTISPWVLPIGPGVV